MIRYNYAEEEVYAFIKSRCSNEEEVQFMPRDIMSNRKGLTIIPDFYVPKGCRMLDIKPKTCIEVKANLNYNTVDHLKAMYDFMHDYLKDDFHLMLVTMENVKQFQTAYNGPISRDINIVYFGDWLTKKSN